jgi:hypothetical protein
VCTSRNFCLLWQRGEAVGLGMDELQELRASVAAAAWSQQAAALLAAVAAVKAAAASPALQQPAQQSEQQSHERQPAIPADGQRPDVATATGRSQEDAVIQQEAVMANGTASAAEQHQPQQPGTSDQVSLWQRIAAAEAAAAAAAEQAEAQPPAAAAADALQDNAAAPGMGTFSQLLQQGSPEAAGQPSQHSMDGGDIAMAPAANAAAEVTPVCMAICMELQMRLAASWLSILRWLKAANSQSSQSLWMTIMV